MMTKTFAIDWNSNPSRNIASPKEVGYNLESRCVCQVVNMRTITSLARRGDANPWKN